MYAKKARSDMVIRDFLKVKQNDYDVYDKDYDMSVTCCDIYPLDEDQQEEYYYKVMDAVYGEVEVLDWQDDGCGATADWSGWIDSRKDKLTSFMDAHWGKRYSDDDFYEQWIREIHLYFAGYADEATYKMFYEEVLA